uniref:Uncharacterized protein n=1 Tax=Oryza brachyantha TaxID=4533 RepID=J3KVC0_ORYBR
MDTFGDQEGFVPRSLTVWALRDSHDKRARGTSLDCAGACVEVVELQWQSSDGLIDRLALPPKLIGLFSIPNCANAGFLEEKRRI